MEKAPATPSSTTVPSPNEPSVLPSPTSSSPVAKGLTGKAPEPSVPAFETPPLRKQAHLDERSLPATESLQSLPSLASLPSMGELFGEDVESIRQDLDKQLSGMLSQDSAPQFRGSPEPMTPATSVLAHAPSFVDTSKEAKVCQAGAL